MWTHLVKKPGRQVGGKKIGPGGRVKKSNKKNRPRREG
jgi:hypothetical protein